MNLIKRKEKDVCIREKEKKILDLFRNDRGIVAIIKSE